MGGSIGKTKYTEQTIQNFGFDENYKIPIRLGYVYSPADEDVQVLKKSIAETPTVYNISMTNANTEYSQSLPTGTKKFTLQCRGNYDIRFAFTSGKVATPTAPYATIKAGMNYYEDNLNLSNKTIYVACGTAGQVAELIVWT